MFKQIVKLAKSTILTPKYEKQADPRQKKNSLIQKYIDHNCIHSYDIRKRMYFEKQCLKYCQLMKKILPKHNQEYLHIRHYSNKGYPWNMFCRRQKALLPDEKDPSENVNEVDGLGEVLTPKPVSKETRTSNMHPCFSKGNIYADIIKEKCGMEKPDIPEGLNESHGKSITTNESYGLSYNQAKCCIAEKDKENHDKLYMSRCEKSDSMNQRSDNIMTTKCDVSNLCRNTKFMKPSNRTYILNPSKHIYDNAKGTETQSHNKEDIAKRKKSDHSNKYKTKTRAKNPCGEPPSMKRSQMLARKFITCNDLKSSSISNCKSDRQSNHGETKYCVKRNPCGTPESQLNVSKFVSEMEPNCVETPKGIESKSKPCIKNTCDVSARLNECSQPIVNLNCGEVCTKEDSSNKCHEESNICMTKVYDSPTSKYHFCSINNNKQEVASCSSMEKEKQTCQKSRPEKVCFKKDKSKCDGKKDSSSCKLPDFGTPSKMNKYTIGGRRRILNENSNEPKSSGCKCPPNPVPVGKKCAKREKSCKSPETCPTSSSACKTDEKYTIEIKTSDILKKTRKSGSCNKKGKEFKFKVKKSTIATCKINRKLRRRMKKRVIEVKYPWNSVPNYSQCLFKALSHEEKKLKEEAAKKEARKLAMRPTKCNYTIKSKTCRKKHTTRRRSAKTCGTVPKPKVIILQKIQKETKLEERKDKRFPWNTDICDSPKSPPRARGKTIPKKPSLKTLRRLARQNQNCLRKMELLAKCKAAKPILDCNKNECDHKQFSTRSSGSGDANNRDTDDGCKCLYCAGDVECKVCPGTCKAPEKVKNLEKNDKKDILCSLCHIFHTRGSHAIDKYFKKIYKNKEYHLFTDAAFLDLLVFLRSSRLPQPKNSKKKRKK